MSADSFLYLSAADVKGLALDPGLMRGAVVEAFQAHHAQLATTRPKLTLTVGPGHAFQSMCAAWPTHGLAANKWLGMVNVAAGSGLPAIHSIIALNDYATGQLRVIMDGNVVTALRTAAMSAAAAETMARPDSRSIGFIGCGLQARSHLAAFRALMPGLVDLHAFSRTRRSAEALVEGATALRGTVHDDPAVVVRESDIVVTTVPAEPGFQPFLDPADIRSGGFVSSVDVGRSWLPGGLRALDVLAVDDHAQQAESPPIGPGLGPLGSFDADLADLVSGSKPGRRGPEDRTLFVFRGFGLADLAVAALVFRAAQLRGSGAVLPR